MLKKGDRVRRIKNNFGSLVVGHEYTVDTVSGVNVWLKGHTSPYASDKFELVVNQPYMQPVPDFYQEMVLSEDPTERKGTPITTGVLDYFPRAIAAVSQCSKAGNDQHNPGQPLHWDRTKSTDHADCIGRHLTDRFAIDTDGIPHAYKLAWRALAFLETLLEEKEKHDAVQVQT